MALNEMPCIVSFANNVQYLMQQAPDYSRAEVSTQVANYDLQIYTFARGRPQQPSSRTHRQQSTATSAPRTGAIR
jgi:hypothetical protein